MEKNNIHYGASKGADDRFRLFVGVALILLSVLWAETGKKGEAEPRVSETDGARATFGDAAKEVWRALVIAYTVNVDAEGRPIPPAFEE